jgi:hypothetical protein
VAYRGTSLRIAGSFIRERPQLYDITFFGDHCTANLAVSFNSMPSIFGDRGKMVPDLPQSKTNFNFYDDILQKYIYDGPKFVSGIRIPVRLDLDL